MDDESGWLSSENLSYLESGSDIGMEIELKLKDVKDKLPPAAREWLRGVSSQERLCLEIILNSVGADSFVEHWKSHRTELQEIRDF